MSCNKCCKNCTPTLTWEKLEGHHLMAFDSQGKSCGWIVPERSGLVYLYWYPAWSPDRNEAGTRLMKNDTYRNEAAAKAALELMYTLAGVHDDDD